MSTLEKLRELSAIKRPLGNIIRKTDLKCDYCGLDTFVVEEPGSETSQWLRCQKCDQYYYTVFGTLCANVLGEKTLSREVVDKELAR